MNCVNEVTPVKRGGDIRAPGSSPSRKKLRRIDPNSPLVRKDRAMSISSLEREAENRRKNFFQRTLYMGRPTNFWE